MDYRTRMRIKGLENEIEQYQINQANYKTELADARAIVGMMADAIDDWEEPTNDGTREWCGRFNAYLRGCVLAQSTFTMKEWAAVKRIREAAEKARTEHAKTGKLSEPRLGATKE